MFVVYKFIFLPDLHVQQCTNKKKILKFQNAFKKYFKKKLACYHILKKDYSY